MANPLTGGFDAVVQLSLREINGLLATLHQDGLDDSDTALKLLHSVRARVGDPRRQRPEVGAFGDWTAEYRQELPAGPRPPLRDLLVASAPPGAARRLAEEFDDLDVVEAPPAPEVVRGTLALQLSTVRVNVEGGSTSEITLHVDIRAQYRPDPGTAPLPEFIPGEVRAVYAVQKVAAGTKTRLLVHPSPQDEELQFIPAPGAGLDAADIARIAVQVRDFLREGIVMLPVDLPEGFPFTDFKALATEFDAVVALPLQLSSNPPPPGGVQAITRIFVGSSGFGVAVSREFVEGLIDVEAIREAVERERIVIHISVLFFSADVTYRLRFSSGPTVEFQQDAIEISGRVEVETSTWWAPNGHVSFRQRFTLVLDPATQRVDLVTLGEPSVDQSWFIPHSRAVNIVKSQVEAARQTNEPAVRRVFQDARTNLLTALGTFEPSATAGFTELEVSPDGVTLRGEISSARRIAPVVEVGEDDQGRAFTALESWIPGGRVDRFTWSWVEYPPRRPSPWAGVAKSVTETNRFVLEKPPGISELSQICLQIDGEQTLPDGSTRAVVGGSVCEVPGPVIGIDAPSWWEPLTIPVWGPDLPEEAAVRDGITAHLSVQADRPREEEPTPNVVVYFPDRESAAPFDALARGVELVRRQPEALTVLVVLPAGSFDRSRRELEALLAPFPPAVAARLQVTEDVDGGWSRTFAVERVPAIFLVNTRREVTWQAAGELAPEAIAAALDEYFVPGGRPRFRPLRLYVGVGDAAPDVLFRDDRGDEGALHRMQGRAVTINFWQSWSAPSLRELRRLQALHDADPRRAPAIVAFHGGPPPESFDGIRKAHSITFPIVQDTEHRAARTFGVRCWPTTVAIGADGRIEEIRLGTGLGSYPEPRG